MSGFSLLTCVMGIEAPSLSISDTGAFEQYNMRNYKSNRDLVLALSYSHSLHQGLTK